MRHIPIHHLLPQLLIILLTSCGNTCQPSTDEISDTSAYADEKILGDTTEKSTTAIPDSPTEARLRQLGLVDIQEVEPTIQVKLIYATPENFVGQVLYHDIHKAFLLPELAQRLAKAQQTLKQSHPDLTLLIWDAARPLSVQQQMFHLVAGTPNNIYVANPLHGPGMHNYAAAVDITLADTEGNLLPMGTEFDHFGPEAHIGHEQQLLEKGAITQQELDNRRLLRQLMRQQGLIPLPTEWWHFNLMPLSQARQTLKPINF